VIHLEEMQRLRCDLDNALERRANATRASGAQQRKLVEVRRRLGARREEMLAERIAAAAASVESTSSAAELQDLQLDIEAAEQLARQLERRQEEANALCDRAEQAWRKSVCKFAQAQEATAVSEIEGILVALGQACARGIAAAKVSREFGEIRGSYNLDTSRWYGSAGQLTAALRKIEWPTWPNPIGPGPFFVQYVNDSLGTLAGVSEAEEVLLGAINGAAE
jgi:hypothetical protein